MQPVRLSLYFLFAAALVFGAFLAQLRSDDVSMIRIDNETYYGTKERSSVNFPHGKHMKMDSGCTACHHDYRGSINILNLKSLSRGNRTLACINCHGKYGKARGKHQLMQAYHSLCIGCHSSHGGPRLCGECHGSKGADK